MVIGSGGRGFYRSSHSFLGFAHFSRLALHIDIAFEIRSILQDHPGCNDISVDPPGSGDGNALFTIEITRELTLDDDIPGIDISLNLPFFADGDTIVFQLDSPFDISLDNEILLTAEFTFDIDR